jgi:hypothetical protein
MRTGVGSNAQGGGRDAGKGTRVRAAGASERKAGARGGCTGELKKYERVFFSTSYFLGVEIMLIYWR